MGALDSLVRYQTVTMHCPVRATLAQPLGFGAVDRWRRLSSSCTGLFGDSVATLLCTVALAESTVGAGSRCSAGSPDSWVNYSGARLHFPESGWFNSIRPWCTGQCPVRHFPTHSRSCSMFNCVPNLIFFLVSVEPYAHVIHEF
jgi:hypothetical protein